MKPIEQLKEELCTVKEIEEDLHTTDYDQEAHTDYDIELPIQERHLRMYIQARINKLFMILWNGDFIECNHHEDNHFNNPEYIFKELITTLDNTKDFHLQDDKVIQQIVDFLTKEQWTNKTN